MTVVMEVNPRCLLMELDNKPQQRLQECARGAVMVPVMDGDWMNSSINKPQQSASVESFVDSVNTLGAMDAVGWHWLCRSGVTLRDKPWMW